MAEKRSPLQYALITVKGVCMGIADVIPGVSGGTIAFITGIYEELVESIRQISVSFRRDLARGRIAAFWRDIHGSFLLALVSGIGISVVSLSRLILWLLEYHPIPVWSFFFGLIVASAIVIFRKIGRRSPGILLSFVVGAVLAWLITSATPAETTTASWFVFVSGAVAICAMILPGISGSFILLLLGKYEFVLQAVRDFRVAVIVVFAAGCIFGLLAFSHLLSWMLRRFHDRTVSLLSGFMIGSLGKIWPWKVTVQSIVTSQGKVVPLVEDNILPGTYLDLAGKDPQLGLAVTFCLVGCLIVLLLERMGSAGTRRGRH